MMKSICFTTQKSYSVVQSFLPNSTLKCVIIQIFIKFLAAGEAEQIQSSVLVFFFFFFFMFMFSFSNLYPYCQSRVSFGYLDFQGTSPQGALYPLGPFTLWGTLPFGALCPQGPFALRGPLPFMIFYFLGHLDFLDLLGSFLIAGSWD